MRKFRIGLIPGHRSRVPGCSNKFWLLNEFAYNETVCLGIYKILSKKTAFETFVFYRPDGNYENAMTRLAMMVNSCDVDWVFEFHCNSAGKKATGYEILHHFRTSMKNKRAIRIMLKYAMAKSFPTPNRGLKPRSGANRGFKFLDKMYALALQMEPGFFSNNDETEMLLNKIKVYIENCAKAICLAYTEVFRK